MKFKIICILLLIVGMGWIVNISTNMDDFGFLLISDQGEWEIVQMSKVRRLVYSMKINSEDMVWVPGGYGFYKSGQVKRLLESEKKDDQLLFVSFFNYGFWPKKVFISGNFNWQDKIEFVKHFGIINLIRYWDCLENYPILSRSVNSQNVGNVMYKDFSANYIVSQSYKLSVYNASNQEGLANFVSDRLIWRGYYVSETSRSQKEITGSCLVMFPDIQRETRYISELREIFHMCDFETNGELKPEEIEIFLGEKYAEVIKYSSYVRTF